jgi:uncharacterized protein (UPF0276 family)
MLEHSTFGLGLRREYMAEVRAGRCRAQWFEAITENFLDCGGAPRANLHAIRADYPLVLHGVSMSIGSVDPLDWAYLRSVAELCAEIEPAWISDHLCWTGCARLNTHDLLPLPYSEEALSHVVERVCQVQDFLKRQLVIENVSSYLTYACSTLHEWEFLRELVARADCRLLLDVNNVYVSARNHGFDAYAYIEALPAERVQQFHLAGHRDYGTHVVDTHDSPICAEVWALYRHAVGCCGVRATLIERDDNFPPLNELEAELDRARAAAARATSACAA